MLSLAEASRLLWCPGLAQLENNPSCTVQEWLSTGTFAPSVQGGSLALTGIDKRHVLRGLAGDVNRTSSAASETLRNIAEIGDIPKSLAWPYVKLYYAALFYAQTLLRMWGRSPSYLRTTDLIYLRKVLNSYGILPPFKLQTGQFLLVANMSSGEVTLTPDRSGGGSHEAIWREFKSALEEFRVRLIPAPYLQADKARIDAEIVAAIALITNNGGNLAWPSQMRNEIQYRQGEGVWYPYSGRQRSADLCRDVRATVLGTLAATALLASSAHALDRFRAACLYIVLFGRAALADMAQVGSARSFLKFGQRRFEDATRLPAAI